MNKNPERPEPRARGLDEMSPKEIVKALDRYVIGQHAAKKAVAIALRNRIRRRKLDEEMAEEVAPKNIIMIGSTGVGKTEIARRLARLANSPFIKVEATKFTEVGYVGRDVESMVRDLVETAVDMVRDEKILEIEEKAQQNTEERLLDILLTTVQGIPVDAQDLDSSRDLERIEEMREKLRKQFRSGKLDSRLIEIDVREHSLSPVSFQVFEGSGLEEFQFNMRDIISGMVDGKAQKRRLPVSEAVDYIMQEEEQKLIDMDQVARTAMNRVEQNGIIFLDEIDKIAGRESGHGPDVSREGVQRDILPIVEGTNVMTRYGMIRTDHILFIAAGAFHSSKPTDLIPEIQGRFPIRVEMNLLGEEEFIRILQEPKNALIRQYTALLATEGLKLRFTADGIREIAKLACEVNENNENIGARRLYTIVEALLEDVSFEGKQRRMKNVRINAEYVRKKLGNIARDKDLSRY
ncbi:MAG: ATP-dependent protease ATPase subunit HslU, partial [Acidobacteria bacterium]|nr:ATP-dependent protease ATPase subunit HslU [Acidobacteriota bacterium]